MNKTTVRIYVKKEFSYILMEYRFYIYANDIYLSSYETLEKAEEKMNKLIARIKETEPPRIVLDQTVEV